MLCAQRIQNYHRNSLKFPGGLNTNAIEHQNETVRIYLIRFNPYMSHLFFIFSYKDDFFKNKKNRRPDRYSVLISKNLFFSAHLFDASAVTKFFSFLNERP